MNERLIVLEIVQLVHNFFNWMIFNLMCKVSLNIETAWLEFYYLYALIELMVVLCNRISFVNPLKIAPSLSSCSTVLGEAKIGLNFTIQHLSLKFIGVVLHKSSSFTLILFSFYSKLKIPKYKSIQRYINPNPYFQ